MKIKNSIKELQITILLILFMIIGNIFLSIAESKLGVVGWGFVFFNILFKIVSFLLIFIIFKINPLLQIKKVKPKYILLSIIIGILYILFEIFILNPIFFKAPQLSIYDYFIKALVLSKNETRVYMFIYTVILAPYLEEVLFRGVILEKLLKRHNKMISIFLSAALFAIYHLSIAAGINALAFGIVSGLIYLKYKNIEYNITLHRTINLITFLILLFR